jgi:ABC-type transport system substrate-binding protein
MAITPSADVLGKAYNNGGFDALFLGYALGIDADPWSYYHSSQFAPIGSNYYLWNNSQNNQLTAQIKQTIDKTQRLDLVKQWQALAYDQQPSATILCTKEIVAFDYTLPNAEYVFSTYHSPYWPPIEQLSMLGRVYDRLDHLGPDGTGSVGRFQPDSEQLLLRPDRVRSIVQRVSAEK